MHKSIIAHVIGIPALLLISAVLSPASANPPAIFPEDRSLPQVLMGEAGRTLIATGDRLYSSALGQTPAQHYYLLRPGPARSSIYLGRAKLSRHSDPAVLFVETAKQEIRPGDYLLAAPAVNERDDG